MTRWLLVLPVVAAGASAAKADSIWDRRDPRYAYLFQDNRARNVGDLVTVIVAEATTANEREQRQQDKLNDASGTATFAGSSSNDTGGRTGALNFSLANTFRRRFNGNSQFTAGRTFTDRMSVTVVDILPNGNLVLEGYRTRVVAGEERVLRITGVARPQDVGQGSIIASSQVANFKVTYLGRGPTTRTVNQNFFGRAVNALWPW